MEAPSASPAGSAGSPRDRATIPSAGPIRPFRFPPFLRRTLPNGLTVYAARHEGIPLVSLELVGFAGGQHDPVDPVRRPRLAAFTAALLDEGTRRRTSLEIAALVERLGGYLYTGADWDAGYLATALLARHRTPGLEMLAELLGSPTFPEAEIERLRQQRLTELLRRGHDPSALADDRFAQVVYGGTVYAHPLIGTTASVSAFDRDTVVDFYQRSYGLRGAALIAVGDLDPEGFVREAEALFGSGPEGIEAHAVPPAPAIEPPALDGIEIHIVDRPGAAQTELRIGHAGPPRTHPLFTALGVLNTLLGGKFTSRINMNLRERHGFTYGASSRFSGRLGPGPFVIDAAVATQSTGAAAREVLGELRRIREEPAGVDELEETRSYLIGVYPYTLQTIGELAKRLEMMAVYGFPDDHYDRYLERLNAVTLSRVQEVARQHIDPEHIAIVAVGPASDLEPQFEGMGPVKVWQRDAE
jgi:zinc protease